MNREVIGLLPAAGQAKRIAPLPCSKELYPLGFRLVEEDHSLRPKVVCHYLLEKMRLAATTKTYVVLREGKWDIPAYLSDDAVPDIHLAYLVIRSSPSVPHTLDRAYPFVRDAVVVFGFPDILFQPDDAFTKLLAKQTETEADVVLGLFPTDQPQKWDMVDMNSEGRIKAIAIKPLQTHLRYAWSIAVWTPTFSHFMHEYLTPTRQSAGRDDFSLEQRELVVGDVLRTAIDQGLRVEGVVFPDGTCLDIGTPEDLMKAVRSMGVV